MAVLDNALLRATGVAGAGTTQATATAISAKHVLTAEVTAGAGVVLQQQFCSEHQEGTIHNGSASAGAASTGAALLVYPGSGAAFNGQTTDLPLTLPSGKGCRWVYFNPTTIGVIYA